MKTRTILATSATAAVLGAAGCATTVQAAPPAARATTSAPTPKATTSAPAPAAASTPATMRAPGTQAPAPATQAPAPAPTLSAMAVVEQFYSDITAGNYSAAWALGGENLTGGVSYAQWVAGYSTTASIDLTSDGTFSGDTVWADIAATQDDGTVKTYYGTYTVADGVIQSADIRETS